MGNFLKKDTKITPEEVEMNENEIKIQNENVEQEEKDGDVEILVDGQQPKPKKDTNFGFSILFYVIVSLSTVFMNKMILSHLPHKFNFPLTMTCFQVLVAFLIMLVACPLAQLESLAFVKKVVELPQFELKFDRIKAVIPACLIFVGMISFNNFCLSYVDVTLYLVFRSLTIFFSMIFSYFILDFKTPFLTILTVCVVVLGYVIGSVGGFQNESFKMKEIIYGGIFGSLSSIFVALNSIFVKKVLSSKFENNHWLLLIYMNFVSFFIFAIIIVVFELKNVLKFEYFLEWDFLLSLFISSICGFSINLAYNFVIKFTTPLTKEITATAKACLQPILGTFVFGDKLNLLTIIGAGVCIFGSFLYSLTKVLVK